MVLPFVPGVGATINDAQAWVAFGSFSFQPSEFLKLAASCSLADLLARRRHELHEPSATASCRSIAGRGSARWA